MSKSLTGGVVAVTGAGGGLGRAIALAFAKRGCRLALSDVQAEAMEETRALLPESASASCHTTDVSFVYDWLD